MDKIKPFFLLTLFFILYSCEQQQENPETITTISQISLDNFKTIPSELDGLICTYSETEIKFKQMESLFACDSDSTAFILVNHQMTKLKLIYTSRAPGTFTDSDHVDIYSNGVYKVTVDTKFIGPDAEETWWNNGTITIQTKTGDRLTKKLYGLCGYRR